jgi:hypothetical protein
VAIQLDIVDIVGSLTRLLPLVDWGSRSLALSGLPVHVAVSRITQFALRARVYLALLPLTRFSLDFMVLKRGLRIPPINLHRRDTGAMPLIFARHKSRLMIIASAVLLCAMAGCGSPHDIVGKWRTSDPTAMVWEFSKNGSVLIGSSRGRYSFGDNNRVKIETPFATSVYRAEFSGDRMILRDPKGSKLEFTRIR